MQKMTEETFSEKTYTIPTCNSTFTTELSQRRLSKEERDSRGHQEDNVWDQENS